MQTIITSAANPKIKQIRALRQRKEREQCGLFLIEGIRIVGEAVQLHAQIETLIVADDLLASPFARELVAQQQAHGVATLPVSAEVFRTLSQKDGPQGIAAVVRQHWEPLSAVQHTGELCWVALDAVQDPGNLGTILRTSDAVGSAGIILIGDSTDPYDPAAVRASMGAIFAQRLVRVSLAEFAAWRAQQAQLGAAGYRIVGAAGHATSEYQAVRYRAPLVLWMGSERQGLSLEQQALCDQLVRIPMVGRSDSLNVAVATAVILYEIFNQARAQQAALSSG